MEISGKTKLYGILGWPVSHSLSPVFQARFFGQYDLDAVYVPFAVPPDKIQQALDGLWAIGVEGANVTVPHKEVVNRWVAANEDAQLIGAVNSLRRTASGWEGCNTDWAGFRAAVRQFGTDFQGSEAVLFGAGGTARAVLHALADLGVARLHVWNRNPERLQAFLSHAQQAYPELQTVALAGQQPDVSTACSNAKLVVNCTSIGLGEEPAEFPFSIAGEGVAMDAVYRPDGATPFCEAARSAGRQAVDGLPMLIAQGAEAFAWWFDGRQPDWLETLQWMEGRLGRQSSFRPAMGMVS